jgi:hypothetical protein
MEISIVLNLKVKWTISSSIELSDIEEEHGPLDLKCICLASEELELNIANLYAFHFVILRLQNACIQSSN